MPHRPAPPLLKSALVIALLSIGHAAAAQAPADRVARLQAALDAEVAGNASLPGQLLHVHAPALGVDTSLAAGVFERASGRPLRPHDESRGIPTLD